MEDHLCPFDDGDASECWIDQIVHGIPVEDASITRDQVNRCLRCEHFDKAVKRSVGRRGSDRLISTAVGRFLGVLSDANTELVDMADDLRRKVEELTVLRTVSEALLGASNLEDCLKVYLTGVTAGEAIGLNRAALFLVNQPKRALEGQLGFGHIELGEFSETWRQIERTAPSFPELIQHVLNDDTIPDSDLSRAVRKTHIPLREEFGLLPAAVMHGETFRVSSLGEEHVKDRLLLTIFGGQSCAIVPIVSEENALGVVIVDNPMTRSEISDEQVSMLETLSYLAASKIDNLILQNQLEIRVAELEHLHKLLKDNQEYLMETERLVEAGKLATAIAHELKTPLITIGGYARHALKSHEKSADISHDISVIIDEISRLEDLTRDVLDYSGKRELNLRDVNLNSFVFETLEILQGKLKLPDLEVETSLSDAELIVRADRNRLKQVLYNLFDNAVQAMSGGGLLTVRTGTESGYCWFSIADTGSGMSEETQANMFQPFYTTKDRGVGLGLPVSRNIVADHGGFIEVTSVAGKGSVFRVNLPARLYNDR